MPERGQRRADSDPRVGIARTARGIKRALRQALDAIGGLDAIVREGETVFVKPNLTGPVAPETGAVTNPEVTRAVVELLFERRPREVFLGDSPSWGFDSEEVYDVTGARRVASETGCTLVNLDKDERVGCRIQGAVRLKRIQVARAILECDRLINLPVMKTHMQSQVTLGLKNMKGVLPLKCKTRLHNLAPWDAYSGLDVGIVDLHKLIRPDLTIVDGTVGMEGRGPFDGEPVNPGLIVAGADTVLVDAVCATIMGFAPEEIPTLRLCAENDGVDLRGYRIVGPSLASVTRPFKPCPAEIAAARNLEIHTGRVCSGCLATFGTAVHRLMKSDEMERLGRVVVVLGRDLGVMEGAFPIVAVGKCTAMSQGLQSGREVAFVKGCPPTGWQIVHALRALGRKRSNLTKRRGERGA